jgi:excisionase family DNA binding protein
MDHGQADREAPSARSPHLYTISEAAKRLRISRAKLAQILAADEVATVRIGRRRLVPDHALAAWIESHTRGGALVGVERQDSDGPAA